ncbi:MAG: lecithin retinol acyltransferase family protein [Clostridia bacterium]|nr:lecithin retinol acyltransferase family protein [Clostridia bacterium]
MKWIKREPEYGDMIRVASGSIYHFGIYVSRDEVIAFGLAPSQRPLLHNSEVEVLSTDIDTFLSGGELEVAEFDPEEKKDHRTPDEAVEFARSKLGMRGYNIIYNNCEHFANEAISGKPSCEQADRVRAMFRNMPVVDIYLAKLPDRDIGEPLACSVRQRDIDGVSNDRVKREKYYVWKLLEYGLMRSFGIKAEELEFEKDKGGRYMTEGVEFSLSHSKGALAVAVSRAPVGIDIEDMGALCRESMPKRIMTDREYERYLSLTDEEKQKFFVNTWTAKEALFKASHSRRFIPRDADTADGGYRSYEKNIGGKLYSLSVATPTPERIRVYENICF